MKADRGIPTSLPDLVRGWDGRAGWDRVPDGQASGWASWPFPPDRLEAPATERDASATAAPLACPSRGVHDIHTSTAPSSANNAPRHRAAARTTRT
jgi:hypothetical protein